MDIKFEDLKSPEQKRLLEAWDDAYYNLDSPLVSDEYYDYCLSYYNSHAKTKYTSLLGKASNSFEKYNHLYPVLSLAKITTKNGYTEYGSKFKYNVVIEPKIDGLTVVYYPDGKMVSRGNGHVGEILINANSIAGLPKPLDKPVRMEVCIDKDVYTTIPNATKNPRNLAAGILRRKTQTEDVKYLIYYAYNILGSEMSEENQLITLKQKGFNVVDYVKLASEEQYNNFFDKLLSLSESCLAPTDGIVIKCNLPEIALNAGATSHHPNNMVAFKFVSQIATTQLKNIEWSRGRTVFTPVAIFDPVVLGGSVVQKASLHNLNIIKKLDIRKHSKLCVTLKNEIIPQIISTENNVFNTNIDIPTECPYCHEKLVINESQELECQNKNCSYLIISDLNRLVSKEALDIVGISEAKCKKLSSYMINKSYTSAFDLFNLTIQELSKALECSFSSATIIYNSILKSSKDVEPAKFLYACNINGLGLNTAKDIMKYFNEDINKFLSNFKEEALKIDGIGDITAKNINEKLEYIKAKALMFSFKTKPVVNNELDKKFVITGTLSKTRQYYEDIITKHGYTFQKSITKATNYLVCGENAGSKKDKALKMGITILTEQELMNILKEVD